MRWEFLEPEKQTIIADEVWVISEHHQVLKTPRAAFQSARPSRSCLCRQLKND
jgi:hypothetical protein